MTLGISILLSLVVFLLLVSKILPPTSLVLPLIAKYLLFTFIMNTVSILVTVIIINWNFRGPRTHSMPNWIRVVFIKYLPIFLFMRRPKKTRLRWMMEMQGGGSHPNTRRLPPPTGGYGDSPERRMGPGGHYSPPPPELPKHLSRGPSREHIPEQMKNKIEVSTQFALYTSSSLLKMRPFMTNLAISLSLVSPSLQIHLSSKYNLLTTPQTNFKTICHIFVSPQSLCEVLRQKHLLHTVETNWLGG